MNPLWWLVSLIEASLLFVLLKGDAVLKRSAPQGKQCSSKQGIGYL